MHPAVNQLDEVEMVLLVWKVVVVFGILAVGSQGSLPQPRSQRRVSPGRYDRSENLASIPGTSVEAQSEERFQEVRRGDQRSVLLQRGARKDADIYLRHEGLRDDAGWAFPVILTARPCSFRYVEFILHPIALEIVIGLLALKIIIQLQF